MIINHNIPALNTYSRLNANNTGVSKSLEKLSSGMRINRAADDAAGLAISEKMRSQIRGLEQATRNVQDGISLIQTAEGALTESHSILQRIRELTVQAANDTYTASDRQQIQAEIDQLTDELDRIADTTQFNGKNLLDGSSAALVSTDEISTRVFMRGGLREVDQFNQKAAGGGNYKIKIEATAGINQIQKTNIFRCKHDSDGKVIIDKLNDITTSGIKSFTASGEPVGNYMVNTVDVSGAVDSQALVDGQFQQKTSAGYGLLNSATVGAANAYNASMYFEVTAVDTTANTVTLTAYSHQYDAAGVYSEVKKEGIILDTAGAANTFDVGNITFTAFSLADTDHFSVGDRIGLNVTAAQGVGDDKVSIANDLGNTREWVLDNNTWKGTTSLDKKTVLKAYYINGETGEVNNAEFDISFNENFIERTAIENQVYGDTNLTAVSGDNLEPATNFTIVTNDALLDASSTAVVEKVYSQAGNTSHINAGAVTSAVNASLLFEVVGIDGNSVRVRVIGDQLATDGTHTAIDQVVALTANGSTTLTGPTAIGGINSLALSLGTADKFEVGDKFTMYVQAAAAAGDDGITVTRQYRDANDELITGTSVSRQVVLADGTAPDITYTAYEMDATSGTVKATKLFLTGTAVSTSTYSCTFNTTDGNAVLYKRGTKVGDVALAETRLYDIEQFWDSNGNFILENPKTITLVQGTGAKAQVIITSADTIQTVQDKINEAIRTAEPKGLGQGALVGGPPLDDNFVSYVTDPPDATGYETVPGTFIIRSAMPGSDGEIDFVGDDSIINALGLMTIQESVSSTFTVNVTDAHTGEVIAENVVVADNNLVGVIHENIDVQFAADAGLSVSWDSTAKNFKLSGGPGHAEETFIHVADNSMIFQIGANQQQDVMAAIGDMGTRALGMDNIQVATNALANEALAKIDSAISQVSAERSKLGAIQNRLDHSYNNLSVTAENLTAAESRIRDVDMAKEMLNFTKYNILSQASTAMLAQANQLPQSVLQLLQ